MKLSQLQAKLAAAQDMEDVHDNPDIPTVVPQSVSTIDEHEKLRRKERMRLLIGALMGLEYGAVGGATMGGEMFGKHQGKFDPKMALRGALIGAPLGSLSGMAGGAILNKMKRYTQEEHPAAPQIHLVTNPSPELIQQVEQAMKTSSAVGRTLGIYSGMMKASYGDTANPAAVASGRAAQPRDPFKLSPGAALYKGNGMAGVVKPPESPRGTAKGSTQASIGSGTVGGGLQGL